MKILIIAPSYYPRTGGVEKHILESSRILQERGHEVVIFVRFHDEIPPKQHVEGNEVIRMPGSTNNLSLLAWSLQHQHYLLNADVIHSHDIFVPLWQKIFPKKYRVHTFHGYEGYPVTPEAISARRHIRSKVPICIGVGAFIEKWYGTSLDHIIYGAVAPPKIVKKRIAKWDAIFYGRLEPDTGIDVYLEGVRLMANHGESISLLVVGSGSLRTLVEDYRDNKLLDIEIREPVNDIYPLLQKSRIAFVSGYLSIIEAAICSIPIISVFTTPIKEDYLKMHPMAEMLSISSNGQEITDAYRKLKESGTSKRVRILNEWAAQQTWGQIANIYESAYKKGRNG